MREVGEGAIETLKHNLCYGILLFFLQCSMNNLDIYVYNFFFQLKRFQTNNLKLESFVTATECRKAIQTAVKHEYVYSLSGILSCKSLV